MLSLPSINPKQETEKIVNFLKSVQKKTGINKVVIGLSGGIDSTTIHFLLKKAYKPENIIGVSLAYDFIKPIVDQFEDTIKARSLKGDEDGKFFTTWDIPLGEGSHGDKKFNTESLTKIRLGNIMARVRMIILFDLAKKNNALVCGTENKSEKLLGYFTRFGDAASDLEPISHLYKTQVYQLAKYLKIPKQIINQSPTAGLWDGQTDEKEFGFTYEEADQVLHLFYDKKMSLEKIKKLKFKNAEKIIGRLQNNKFKLETPYSL